MRTYADSLLERKVTNLKQELIKLKANQRYGINQSQLYTSNSIRLHSRMVYSSTQGGVTYYDWEIFSLVKVTGKLKDKTILPSIKFNAFDKNGNPAVIDPEVESEEDAYDNIFTQYFSVGGLASWMDKKNEYYYIVCYYLITRTSGSSNFYMDFWVNANDDCVIEEIKQYTRPT